MKRAWAAYAEQASRQIGLAQYAYANDHQGQYPDGESSTEVFQTLLNGGYVTDPAIFYLPLPGKIVGSPRDKKLKPENVAYDVTSGVDAKSPDDLPVVFMTGYHVSYQAGADAIPVIKPYPRLNSAWLDWWRQETPVSPGTAVCHKMPRAEYLNLDTSSATNFHVRHFIGTKFMPTPGHTYRQLTPEGLAP